MTSDSSNQSFQRPRRRPFRDNAGPPRPHRGPSRPRDRGAPQPAGQSIEVTIDRIVGDGKGIGFTNGQTVFVPETAPGDTVRATVLQRKGKVIQARLDEVLTPSPQRIEPPCPYFDRCGGCDFQQLSHMDQVKAKAEMIADSLRRIAKVELDGPVPMIYGSRPLQYRTRAEWQIDQRSGHIGYFMAHSHEVIDVEICPILDPSVQLQLTALRDDYASGLVPKQAREYRGVSGDTGGVLEPTNTPRSRLVMQTVGGYLYRFSAECFFQSNIPMTEMLLDQVLPIAETAREAPGIAIDLYCGVGLFTVPLAQRFDRVIGVESFPTAVKFAEENLVEAGGDNGRIATAQVEHWLAGDRSPLGHVALVIFDPPRSGAGPAVVDGMLRLKPAHIAAVSCDPATFARDIRGLMDGGYELVSVQGLDMFPQTHHVELVGHLRRSER